MSPEEAPEEGAFRRREHNEVMDAVPEVDRDAELAMLRRRAYGPDADIAGDPAALARLRELEAAERAVAPTSVVDTTLTPDGEQVATDESIPAPNGAATVLDSSQQMVGMNAPGEVANEGAAPEVASRPRRTRRTLWAAAVTGLVAGVALTTGISWIAGPHPDATLHPVTDADEEWDTSRFGDLAYMGIRVDEMVSYGTFRGSEVWVGESDRGNRCIAVVGAPSAAWGFGCGVPPLDPTVDVVRWSDGYDPLFEGLELGSIVRFTLDGDVIHAWVGAAPSTT